MPYYIRDDRVTPQEARYINAHRSPLNQVTAVSPKLTRHGDLFIHAAPTVMHVECVKANIPGVKREGNSVGEVTASMDARDRWATDNFGPGHALCWDRVWTNDPERAPACFFCGKPVMGDD